MELTKTKNSLQVKKNTYSYSNQKDKNKTFSYLFPQSQVNLKPEIKRFDRKIQKAYIKYDSLNQQYKSVQLKNQIHFMNNKPRKLYKNNDQNKLRHLENMKQINRVQQELQKRQTLKSHRGSKNVKKYNKSDKNNYLATYRNFLKERIQGFEIDSDEEKQQSKSSQNRQFENLEEIQFTKQLKKHPKIIKYTKDKILQKKQFFEDQTKQRKKAKSLIEMNALKNKQLYEHYQKISARTNYQQHKKGEDMANALKIVQGKMNKIIKRKNRFRLPDNVLNSQRCCKFLDQQTIIFSSKENDTISKQNKNKLKQRFNQLTIELGKSQLKLSPENQVQNLKQSLRQSLEKSKSFFVAPRKKFQTILIGQPEAIDEGISQTISRGVSQAISETISQQL